jgi:hypothetical protein
MKAVSRLISWAFLLIPLCGISQTTSRFSVVINEFFADPTPSKGLPSSEFIELFNASSQAIDLYGWMLSDKNSAAIIKQHFVLEPDSVVILCATSAADDYGQLGPTIGLSGFPSLDNESDQLILYDDMQAVIHAISYARKWYGNPVKEDGGWSCEMIDARNPCGDKANWKASLSEIGGTPGRKNSIAGINVDELAPSLLRTYSLDPTRIVAVFDESLDSLSASTVLNYSLDNNIRPASASPIAALFNEVILHFNTPISTTNTHELTVNNVTDCSGNSIGIYNKAKAGIALKADTGSIVINEILFNTKSGNPKFVEIYNRSGYAVNCTSLFVGNKTATGTIENLRQIAESPLLIFPGDYLAITTDKTTLSRAYNIKNEFSVIEIPSLPSMPEDKGTVIILNAEGLVIDELSYNKDWHFALLKDDEGVSLERLDYNHTTQSKNNWASAASTTGFGTPGYQNSQFRLPAELQGELTVSPAIFSPDNDGFDDYAIIEYKTSQPAQMANITIFNSNGKIVRHLGNNELIGNSARIAWDGLDEKKQNLPIGIYIIHTEVFSLDGRTKKLRAAIVLAKRF